MKEWLIVRFARSRGTVELRFGPRKMETHTSYVAERMEMTSVCGCW